MFLRMVARPLMSKAKQTTGIQKVREDTVPNAREVLIGLYTQILNQAKKLPEDTSIRDYVEERMNHNLKVCQLEEEDPRSISIQLFLFPRSGEKLIEDARRELSEISGLVADCVIEPIPRSWESSSWESTRFLCFDENPSERDLLIALYNKTLNVIRKVPENNKLRMFAESSVSRKLEAILPEFDWESIKSKLDYEDPIQKAQEELDHWSLFFGPDAYPNRSYPDVPRTKEFRERFDAWRKLASPDMHY